MTDTADDGTDFVHVPPGTPTRFPATQLFSNERREIDVPLAQRVVADLNTALLEQLLHVPVAQWEAVVQPNRVLDDADRETVAIGRGVNHGPTLLNNLTEHATLPNVSITQREAEGQLNCLLTDRHRKSVAVRLLISHGGFTSLNPVKATQPLAFIPGT